MEKQSRRGVLKNAAAAAVGAAGAATLVPQAVAQGARPSKKTVPWNPPGPAPAASGPAPAAAPYSAIVTFGNLVFLSGVGAHFKGTIEEQTKHVLDEIEQKLKAAGSSMDKVLKVNVYLSDLANYARMNAVYAGRWGSVPPVRTTIAAAGGIPGDSLVEIDCIASM
ncbi:MAG TPA: RidA family protein [Acidobacteriaceae bacterium]|nr:RidA family protein [Acidobacteriaceae bacterium]